MAYPDTLDNLATNKTNATVEQNDHPAHHNALATSVNATQAELGLQPKGTYASVRARLDAIQDTSDAYTLTNAPAARRTLNASDYSTDEVVAMLFTLIQDLKDRKVIG